VATMNKVSGDCVETFPELVRSAGDALPLTKGFPIVPLDSVQPWAGLVALNVPGAGRTGVPILIAQGDNDPLVRPKVTERFVEHLCREGESLHFIIFPGNLHFAPSRELTAEIIGWLEDRFAGDTARDDCPRNLLVSMSRH
jgi:hypothetical protein